MTRVFEPEAERGAIRARYETEVRPFFASGGSGSFTGTGGLTLRYIYIPARSPRGALIVLPGKGEPYLKYAELLYDLRGLGLDLYAMDHRGMGYSDRLLPDRQKVHVERFGDYVADVVRFLQQVVRPSASGPTALLGHSTGAVIAARLLQEHPGAVDAAILSSPAFAPRLGALPAWLARALARALDRPGRGQEYAPGEESPVRIPYEHNLISHSYARWQRWEEVVPAEHPGITLGGVTRRWLRELLDAGRQAVERAESIREPLLLLQAGEDRVARRRPQESFCRRCRTCTLVRIAEARHEIPIEADSLRTRALEEIGRFLRSCIPGKP